MWDEIDQNGEPEHQPGAWADKDASPQADSSLMRGGSFYQFQRTLRLADADDPRTARRAFLFALVAWLPLVALAGAQGLAVNPDPRRSLLMDFTVYARFLIAIPLFLIGERVADNKYSLTVDYLARSEIIPESERQSYADLLSFVRRLRDSRLAEALLVLLAFFGAWYSAFHQAMTRPSTWLVADQLGSRPLSWAGAWYAGVSLPLFQFLFFRSLWGWAIWFLFLIRLSRFKLRLMPTHPDLAGGLYILGDSPYAISIFVLAIGGTLSAAWANQVVYDGVPVVSFNKVFIAYLLITLLLAFGPLIVFAGKLDRLRSRGLRDYGALASRHARLFDDKWIKRLGAAEGIEETPLGSPDMSSLADLNTSCEAVKKMKFFPFGARALIALAAAALLPMFPLILMQIPLKEIVSVIARAIF
jgi:hypothetical protein